MEKKKYEMPLMKICKTKFRTLTVLIIALAALTACSSDNEILNDQPVNPTAPKTYTMIVQATKGDAAATRGLSLDGKTINVKWNEGEKIVAVLLAFSVIHLAQSRRHEERLLNRSAHKLAGLISRRLRLSHLLGSPFI